jgi:anaerobic selenocysteine-containing dehydrogenase
MLHVIVAEHLVDRAFVAEHTVGFDALAAHLTTHTPAWAAEVTGVPAERIVALARRYATTRPATIVLGGSSMHKGAGTWTGARAIGCLPALTGNVGIAGGGFGPRHGSATHGQGLTNIGLDEQRPTTGRIPNQMSSITEAMLDGRLRVMLLLGTDMLSSFAEAGRVAEGLARQDLVVSYDLFLNDTARRFADVVLPATAWLEELGCKSTNTHLYLMPKILEPPAETRPIVWVLRALAQRLGLDDFFPWSSDSGPLDAILDHPATGHASVAALAAEGGMRALNVSAVAHPDLKFPTPSGKIELYSSRAATLGLSPLPEHEEPTASARYPLTLRQGRTLTHFHGFYDHGQALPTLAKADPGPALWISPADAAARGVIDGATIRIHNERGVLSARALVTERIPPGTVWMRDGWLGLNDLTAGASVIPDTAVDAFGFSGGQAAFDARVEVERV